MQRMEKVKLTPKLASYIAKILFLEDFFKNFITDIFFPDSDKDEGSYCPPVKRERTSSFPPPHSGKCTW